MPLQFHILPSNDEQSRLLHAAKVANKAISNGLKSDILLPKHIDKKQMQDLLYACQGDAFLPAAPIETLEENHWLVNLIDDKHDIKTECVINLSEQYIAQSEQLKKIFVVVNQQESVLALTRNFYTQYKESGSTPKMIKL
jgi:DNA polymerase IIIc chi subunit